MNTQYRLLIADDEETFLHSTADALREQGYQIDCATSADSVAELIKKQSYNLLISDINTPNNSGLEFIKAQAESVTFLPANPDNGLSVCPNHFRLSAATCDRIYVEAC